MDKKQKEKNKTTKSNGEEQQGGTVGEKKINKQTRRDTKMCQKHFVKRLKEAPLKDKEKKSK